MYCGDDTQTALQTKVSEGQEVIEHIEYSSEKLNQLINFKFWKENRLFIIWRILVVRYCHYLWNQQQETWQMIYPIRYSIDNLKYLLSHQLQRLS